MFVPMSGSHLFGRHLNAKHVDHKASGQAAGPPHRCPRRRHSCERSGYFFISTSKRSKRRKRFLTGVVFPELEVRLV